MSLDTERDSWFYKFIPHSGTDGNILYNFCMPASLLQQRRKKRLMSWNVYFGLFFAHIRPMQYCVVPQNPVVIYLTILVKNLEARFSTRLLIIFKEIILVQ